MSVLLNGLFGGHGGGIVQELRARAQSPKRYGANFVGGIGGTVLLD